MTVLERANHGLGQLDLLATQASASEIGQFPGISFFSAQIRSQHCTGSDSCHIVDDRSQLHVGVFQNLLKAIDNTCAVSHQATAIASQFPQLALGSRWDKAGAQQPMLEQICNPLGILHICLPTGNRFDVLGIDQQDGHFWDMARIASWDSHLDR